DVLRAGRRRRRDRRRLLRRCPCRGGRLLLQVAATTRCSSRPLIGHPPHLPRVLWFDAPNPRRRALTSTVAPGTAGTVGALDNDLYQSTMSQYAYRYEPDRLVRYRFRNRTFAVPLAEAIDLDELVVRLERVSATGFTTADVRALAGLDLFDDAWLTWVATVDH